MTWPCSPSITTLPIHHHDKKKKVRVYGARALGYLGSAQDFVTLVHRATSTAATRQLCARIEAELARIIASADYSVKVCMYIYV